MDNLWNRIIIHAIFSPNRFTPTAFFFFFFFGLPLCIEHTSSSSCPERRLSLFTGLEALHVFLRANVKKDCKLPKSKNKNSHVMNILWQKWLSSWKWKVIGSNCEAQLFIAGTCVEFMSLDGLLHTECR